MSFLSGASQTAQNPQSQYNNMSMAANNPITGPGVGLGFALAKLIQPANSNMTGAVKPDPSGGRDMTSGQAKPNAQQWMDVFSRGGGS